MIDQRITLRTKRRQKNKEAAPKGGFPDFCLEFGLEVDQSTERELLEVVEVG